MAGPGLGGVVELMTVTSLGIVHVPAEGERKLPLSKSSWKTTVLEVRLVMVTAWAWMARMDMAALVSAAANFGSFPETGRV